MVSGIPMSSIAFAHLIKFCAKFGVFAGISYVLTTFNPIGNGGGGHVPSPCYATVRQVHFWGGGAK